jgi:hypothetical protein
MTTPAISPGAAARIEDARNARDLYENAAAQYNAAVHARRLAVEMLAEAQDILDQCDDRIGDTTEELGRHESRPGVPSWLSLTCGCRRGTGLAWCYVCELPTREGIEEEL